MTPHSCKYQKESNVELLHNHGISNSLFKIAMSLGDAVATQSVEGELV